ncbi:MAG: antibiotic biosynthesis monooxygenase family protein [Pseudomonadota bacterium]
MPNDKPHPGPIMRLFQVEAKPGCAQVLLEKFSTTSAEVVRGEPGNAGYLFGRGVATDGDYVVFASIWRDLQAVKARFGDDWQTSFLPPGYDDLIQDCSVRHIDLSEGWHVDL